MPKTTQVLVGFNTKSYMSGLRTENDLEDAVREFIRKRNAAVVFRLGGPEWVTLNYIKDFAERFQSVSFMVETEAKLSDRVGKNNELHNALYRVAEMPKRYAQMITCQEGRPTLRVLYGNTSNREWWANIASTYAIIAARNDVVLGVENIPSDTAQLPGLESALPGGIQLIADIGNLTTVKDNPDPMTGHEALRYFAQRMNRTLYHHLKQTKNGVPQNEVGLQDGDLDMGAYIREVRNHHLATGIPQILVLEPSNSNLGLLEKDITYVRRLLSHR